MIPSVLLRVSLVALAATMSLASAVLPPTTGVGSVQAPFKLSQAILESLSVAIPAQEISNGLVDHVDAELEFLLDRYSRNRPTSTDKKEGETHKEWIDTMRLQSLQDLRRRIRELQASLPDYESTGRPKAVRKRQIVLDSTDSVAADQSAPATEVASITNAITDLLTSSSVSISSASSVSSEDSSTSSSASSISSTTSASASSSGNANATQSTPPPTITNATLTTTSSRVSTATSNVTPVASIPSIGQEGQMIVEVVESNTNLDTPVGPMIQQCLTIVADSSQTFCRTLLDGEVIGTDAGFGQLPVAAPLVAPSNTTSLSSTSAEPSSTALAAAQESQNATSQSIASSTAVAAMNLSSATVSATTSVSVDFVVNAAVTESASLTESVSVTDSAAEVTESATSSLGESASPTNATTTLENTIIPTESVNPSNKSSAILSSTGFASPASATASIAIIPQATAAAISSAAASASAAAAALAQAEAVPATEVPGQRVSVLPIGLGVFGGLAVIALLVVGYVMWERKKYRGQFLKRKEAEKSLSHNAATMGGGSGYGTAV